MNHRVAVFAAIGMMGWVFYWFDNAGNVLLRRTLVGRHRHRVKPYSKSRTFPELKVKHKSIYSLRRASHQIPKNQGFGEML